MRRLVIQARRPATSLSPFMIGRDGLPPAKAIARPAPSSTRRSEAKRLLSLRMVASRSGETRWPCTSMIIPFASTSGLHRHGSRLLARGGDHVAELRDPDRQTVHRDPERPNRVLYRACDRRRRAEIAGLARALLAEHGMRRRRHVMDDLDRRDLVRRRQQVIHQALRDELALLVVGKLLVQR